MCNNRITKFLEIKQLALASQLWHTTGPDLRQEGRIHYNYDDNHEEKEARGGGEGRETSLRHARITSNE